MYGLCMRYQTCKICPRVNKCNLEKQNSIKNRSGKNAQRHRKSKAKKERRSI